MDIKWLGHACFLLQDRQGVRLVMDPYNETIGYKLPYPTADIVTLSHEHRDHGYVAGVRGNPQVVRTPGPHTVRGIAITGIATHHDEVGGQKRGSNMVYCVTMDDVRMCHLGDLGHPLSAPQLEALDGVDVLMAPVGGTYTLDARQAADLVRQVRPRIVIPMHYKTPALNFPLAPVDDFLQAMGVGKVSVKDRLTVERDTLPAATEVVLLDYR
ncbi:MAG: MBL fold metallo-hydrolase [Chloroflexi bacterium]|nr:MBL fold metallo-hydrolase [Chloroflexota bacterium]MBU1746467.1 MBL fold metallo-hydrolase [Chloroflexota bacterium]MBU1879466.1 MBL fold metallo-hydrolase [Chloroflexota bacterium]